MKAIESGSKDFVIEFHEQVVFKGADPVEDQEMIGAEEKYFKRRNEVTEIVYFHPIGNDQWTRILFNVNEIKNLAKRISDLQLANVPPVSESDFYC